FEWSEQHPTDQLSFTGGDCTLDNAPFPSCVADTCQGGTRAGLFCRAGHDDDCRQVAVEGTCVSGGCTTGLVGKSGCVDQNDCDLGVCLAGNMQLGCVTDADCNLNGNDCDAIPLRPAGPIGSSFIARQCATISFEKLFAYDCTSSLRVTVQD